MYRIQQMANLLLPSFKARECLSYGSFFNDAIIRQDMSWVPLASVRAH